MSKSRIIKFDGESRDHLKEGVKLLLSAVSSTMGPSGYNVLIQRDGYPTVVTKDGVTVANYVQSDDQLENEGISMIRNVANRVNELAGDGTTTSTVLASSIYLESLKLINSGVSPITISKGIKKYSSKVIEVLKEKSINVTTIDAIRKVATISSNNDEEIGSLIAEVYSKVGLDGVINITEGKSYKDEYDIVEGFKFNSGYESPYFITNKAKEKCEFLKPYILLFYEKLTDLKVILPALEHVAQNSKPLVIITESYDSKVLSALVSNNNKGTMNVCLIKIPGIGSKKDDMFEDLSISTGASIINSLSSVSSSSLGEADSIEITNTSTTILKGKGDAESINIKVKQLEEMKSEAESQYVINSITERINRLSKGVAIIKVGASSEVELGERRDRYDDAISATSSAIEEGIVIGGGQAFFKLSKLVEADLEGDELLGANLLKKCLESPINYINSNAGLNVDTIKQKLLEKNKWEYGFDTLKQEYVENIIEHGIIDPTKVERIALESAVSVACTLLTTNCSIVFDKHPDSYNY